MFSNSQIRQIAELAKWFCGDDNPTSIAEIMELCMIRGIACMRTEMELGMDADLEVVGA